MIVDYSPTSQDLHLATCRTLCTSNTWCSTCTALVADTPSGCTHMSQLPCWRNVMKWRAVCWPGQDPWFPSLGKKQWGCWVRGGLDEVVSRCTQGWWRGRFSCSQEGSWACAQSSDARSWWCPDVREGSGGHYAPLPHLEGPIVLAIIWRRAEYHTSADAQNWPGLVHCFLFLKEYWHA